MSSQAFEVSVRFNCQLCGNEINITFLNEQVASAQCSQCGHVYNLMKPTIGEEILLDWKGEAELQKARADRSQEDISSIMKLIVNVIELLTWRDRGNGQSEAIEAMRTWLLYNGVPKPLSDLIREPARKSQQSP